MTATRAISEKAFQAQVVELATMLGWLHFHVFNSRKSDEGYPDLTLVRDGRLVYAELKTETGELSPEQIVWLGELREVARERGIEVYEWRPSDWEKLSEVLR